MENRYLNKYRNRTNRQPRFDYGSSNTYFITMVVQNREKAFGEIIDEKMELSEIGKTAHQEWLRTFELRKSMNLKQGEFVVMPDHFHAVISIGNNEHNRGSIQPNKMGVQSQTIGSIVRGFKSAVTTYARKNGITFNWQQDYYDHIIRSRNELKQTEQYIRDNPKNYGKSKKERAKSK